MPTPSILFSAISGYGYYYLDAFLQEFTRGNAVVAGIIDPTPEKSGHYSWIQAQGIPVFDTIDEFFNNGYSADLTVISSPLQFHVQQAISALQHGSHVLVDKPVGVSEAEVQQLIDIQHKTGLSVEVGYQWSFSDAIQNVKQDILAGRFGRPLRMKSICLWPREYSYYLRNRWAGRIHDDDGKMVYDSPANNACAHFLHNMFFILGDRMDSSLSPQQVEAQLLRAYDIENYDTVTCRIRANEGVELFFTASHVTEKATNPEFVLELEGAIIRLDNKSKRIEAWDGENLICVYGHPDDTHQFTKLFRSIEAIRSPMPAICPPAAAISQTQTIEAMQNSAGGIENFTQDSIVHEANRRWVKGLGERLVGAYSSW